MDWPACLVMRHSCTTRADPSQTAALLLFCTKRIAHQFNWYIQATFHISCASFTLDDVCRAGAGKPSLHTVRVHHHWVWRTQFNPQHAELLLSCSSDGTAKVFTTAKLTLADEVDEPMCALPWR